MKLNRIDTGWYASEDGEWAIIADGYEKIAERDREGSGAAAGITGNEWALVRDYERRMRTEHNAGVTIDWFDKKGDAKVALDRIAG